MGKIKKTLILSEILIFTLLQSGCWDQKIFEKIGFILQTGVELSENNKIVYTINMPEVDPYAKEKVEVLSTTTNLIKEAKDKLILSSGKNLEGGKNQELYFSKEIARNGLDEYLEYFLRSPESSLIASLVVVEGSPKELIEYSKDFRDKQRPSFYVNDLLDEAIKNSFTVESKIYQYSILSHSRTIDPTATYIGYDKNGITVLGAALFNGDKMVGTINTKQAAMLNSLVGKKNTIHYSYNGTYAQRAQNNKKNGASIDMKLKKRKVKVKTTADKVTIDIDLKFKGAVIEYLSGLDLSNPKDKKLFEADVSNYITSDCADLVAYLKDIGADPVGFGEMMRAKHNKYWKTKNWKDEYKRAEINVNAKLDIEFFGAITNQ